jgi:hypothetical protein
MSIRYSGSSWNYYRDKGRPRSIYNAHLRNSFWPRQTAELSEGVLSPRHFVVPILLSILLIFINFQAPVYLRSSHFNHVARSRNIVPRFVSSGATTHLVANHAWTPDQLFEEHLAYREFILAMRREWPRTAMITTTTVVADVSREPRSHRSNTRKQSNDPLADIALSHVL